jgi:hypothetical protein
MYLSNSDAEQYHLERVLLIGSGYFAINSLISFAGYQTMFGNQPFEAPASSISGFFGSCSINTHEAGASQLRLPSSAW